MSGKLVTIEDSTIKAMMQDPTVLEALPCLNGPKKKLASVKPGGTNCTRCNREKNNIRQAAMQVARDCIKSARGERLATIKKALNAQSLRIVAKNSKGKRVQFTL